MRVRKFIDNILIFFVMAGLLNSPVTAFKMGAVSMPAEVHKKTATYGGGADAKSVRKQEMIGLQTNPRSTLAIRAREARKLLLGTGVDRTSINKAVQDAIKANNTNYPSIFKKTRGNK